VADTAATERDVPALDSPEPDEAVEPSLRTRRGDLIRFLDSVHPAAWLVALGMVLFAVVFGMLGVQNHRNFGTWSYDMGIYDQSFWLVSRGESFVSVRGLDFWGHHVNLIVIAFVPFYWLGAGPSFLYVVQACVLALGAWPIYLIARDKFNTGWMGLLFAVVYLMYAPVQWISWAMFHPEALVITPMLFAWWFATKQRWRWFFAMILLALSTREDTALAVTMMAVVLLVYLRGVEDQRRVRIMCASTFALGVVWYLVCTRIVLVSFNDGKEPFYITYFYGSYGDNMPEIVRSILTRPDRVVSDAVQHDRLTFYKQMMWPVGWLAVLNPLALLIALPQVLASVIGASPYARMIKYQYTSIMIAPVMIASIHGAYVIWRYRAAHFLVPVWLVACSYVTNVAWAPSPIGTPANYAMWSRPNPRHESLRTAIASIPDDAAVSATFQLLPHLSHRREIYDWPNPFTPAIWGNDDCDRLPDPRTIDYVAIDRTQIGKNNQALFDAMFVNDGPFVEVFADENVVVGKRVGSSPEVDVQPQASSCQTLVARRNAG
jgi:uncharacterized membrane protein